MLDGPNGDGDGAKWNALPRHSDAPVGMTDGELIARAIGNVGALLARAIRPDAFDDASTAAREAEGKALDVELDRREAARKEKPCPSSPAS